MKKAIIILCAIGLFLNSNAMFAGGNKQACANKQKCANKQRWNRVLFVTDNCRVILQRGEGSAYGECRVSPKKRGSSFNNLPQDSTLPAEIQQCEQVISAIYATILGTSNHTFTQENATGACNNGCWYYIPDATAITSNNNLRNWQLKKLFKKTFVESGYGSANAHGKLVLQAANQ